MTAAGRPPSIPFSALPDHLQLPDVLIPLEWRRSSRARRLSIRLSRSSDSVIITLPATTPAEAGLKLLRTHTGWVEKQLQRRPAPIRLVDGGYVPLDGQPHRIRHVPQSRGGAWLAGEELHVSGDPTFLARRVGDFLRELGKERLRIRLMQQVTRIDLHPTHIAVRDTTSRWGSCSATGRIMLSWRLVMAPLAVQDYVILHELCHLRHHNHGTAFWKEVERVCPGYRTAEEWLSQHGSALMRAG
ncbi:M48 family metallopeptidase [Acetobacter estunensis]|uniref:M48 family metallopeptidase n=1 Tax=Acetobacter estunensis TaxID=104097 RepID=UPI001C2D1B2F|nr:SprT family zinc-dependent metalloprotease [Acetobacter estunensis]MBV1837403.1 M48 family metallopeptidase [Acetobacter estunensis]